MTSTARLVSLAILTTLIVFLGITFYHVIAPFLLPLFLAGVSAVLCQPVYKYFCRRTHDRKRIAAGLTTAAMLAVVLVPLATGIFIATVELVVFTQNWAEGKTLNDAFQALQEQWDLEATNAWLENSFGPGARIDPEQLQQDLRESGRKILLSLAERSRGIAGAALGVLGQVGAALLGGVMFVIAFYYFLADGPAMLAATESLIPVHADYQRQLLRQFDKTVRSVILATFLSALAQGITTGLLVYVFGVWAGAELLQHFFIITLICTLASMIPIVGTWMVWGPAAVWLLMQGHWIAALLMTAIGAGVIGTMDNLIRAHVLHTDTKLHPLLAFIAVLGGLQAMGLWGIFIGPIVATCLHALVKVFNMELKELSRERAPRMETLPAPPVGLEEPDAEEGVREETEDDAQSKKAAAEEAGDGKSGGGKRKSKRKKKKKRS